MSVVSKEELARYCKLDEDALIEEAVSLAETMERRLQRKGAVDTPATHADFCLAVKMLTLHELDHPGEKIPQGIQDVINELKLVKHSGGGSV
jgi:hypothetical protein